jgi:hypothetical protein
MLTDDQYLFELGKYTRVMSRKKSAADMGRGRAERDRTDPGWRSRVHVSAQWSLEDRQQQRERSIAAWARPEMESKKQAARERLQAWRSQNPNSEYAREVTSERMLQGGAKAAVAARKIMAPEKVAEREERDAMIVRNYYLGKMPVPEIAKLYGLDWSYVYRILRKTQL